MPAEKFGNISTINQAALKLVEDHKLGRPPKTDKSNSKTASSRKKGNPKYNKAVESVADSVATTCIGGLVWVSIPIT